jgi:hypothetical protein
VLGGAGERLWPRQAPSGPGRRLQWPQWPAIIPTCVILSGEVKRGGEGRRDVLLTCPDLTWLSRVHVKVEHQAG